MVPERRRKTTQLASGASWTDSTRRRISGPPKSFARPLCAMFLLVVLASWSLWPVEDIPPDPPFSKRPRDESSPFAYVFLLGGVDPDNLTPFLGYLYNILVATHTLRTTGSRAEILVLIQPKPQQDKSTLPTRGLPDRWHSLLVDDMGVKVQYLANDAEVNFFSIMMQKFKVLELTQYQRILFLDADIIPFCNLDYLFQASMDGVIQPNFVLAGTDAPAAGNFFLLQPATGEYNTMLKDIVEPTMSAGKWDGTRGWGHTIDKDDPWQRLGWGGSKFMRKYLHWGQKGYHWNFHGGPADQGLLYHWVKYVKRNVTIAVGPIIETWRDNGSKKLVDMPVLVNRTDAASGHPLHALSCRKQLPMDYKFRSKEGLTAPYSDYEHNKKVWERHELPVDVASRYQAKTPAQFWFHTLRQLDTEHKLQIDWKNWLEHIGNKERPFGKGPKLADLEGAGQTPRTEDTGSD